MSTAEITSAAPDASGFRDRLRAALKRKGLSGRELAKAAGYGPTYVNDILSGKSAEPSAERIIALAEKLGESPAFLIGDSAASPRVLAAMGQGGTVPRLAARIASSAAFLAVSEEAADRVAPIPAAGDHAYAFVVPNESNAPRYMPGDTVHVSPEAELQVGHYAFVRRKDGKAGIGRLESENKRSVTIRTLSGEAVTITRADLLAMHRIVGVTEA